jgi:uncharacterized protein YdhG (YjbR/CyaY superfamily)
MADNRKSAKSTTAKRKRTKVFTAEERDAMVARAQEAKAEAGGGRRADKAAAEKQAALDSMSAMPEADRVLAERLHALVTAAAPALSPKTWYGMPAYANRDGKVVCFFTPAEKFKERYATFGFQPEAKLDEGNMWPTSFALTKLTAADEARIAALVKKAVS